MRKEVRRSPKVDLGANSEPAAKQESSSRRTLYVLRLISLALLVQMACSPNLWWNDDNGFFKIPLHSAFSWEAWFDQFLTLVLGIMLGVASFVAKARRALCLSAIGVIILLVFKDLNRLQAWVFQYAAMLSVFGLTYPKDDEKSLLGILRWMMALTYFWAGFHKLSYHYHENVHGWLMGIFEVTKQFKDNETMSYAQGWIELAMGAALLFRPLWRIMPWIYVILHSIILVFLSADGWNSVVWPWNLTMVGLVFLLFFNTKDKSESRWVGFFLKSPSFYLVFLFMGIMPAFYTVDKWDAHLSLAMYSGRSVEVMFFMTASDSNCVPAHLHKEDLHTFKDNTGMRYIYADTWSYGTINTPVYASEWAYEILLKKYCSCLKDKFNGGMTIKHFPMNKREAEERPLYCE